MTLLHILVKDLQGPFKHFCSSGYLESIPAWETEQSKKVLWRTASGWVMEITDGVVNSLVDTVDGIYHSPVDDLTGDMVHSLICKEITTYSCTSENVLYKLGGRNPFS